MQKKDKVILDWMGTLPWKQQSVVLSALRGPDTLHAPNLKKVIRWLRSHTQNNADPKNSQYMQEEPLPTFKELEHELNFCNLHYVTHLMQGIEIIGYKHPDKQTATDAIELYKIICKKLFHLTPETKLQLDKRLEDKT